MRKIRDSFYTCNFEEYLMIRMGIWRQISQYFYLRKPDKPETKWVGYMHWINRICFFMFILCMIILAIKLLR